MASQPLAAATAAAVALAVVGSAVAAFFDRPSTARIPAGIHHRSR
jgi:hypothetical protein